ncbi:MAG: T9SS type A sorting domain-containing protein [Candidatus Eisenbacteria bacterium]
MFDDDSEHLSIDVCSENESRQVALSLLPSSAWVETTVDAWDTAGTHYKSWWEVTEGCSTLVEHTVGGLIPDSYCAIRVDATTIDSCMTGGEGELSFAYSPGCSVRYFEIIEDSMAVAGASHVSAPACGLEGPSSLSARPNPFEAGTEILYHLPRSCHVSLRIYSVNGRLVCYLTDGEKPMGVHSAHWDGLDSSGEPSSPGIYFCRLDAPGTSVMSKVVLVR